MNESNLLAKNTTYYINLIKENIIEFAPKVLLAVLVLWIGFKIIKKFSIMLDKSLKKVQVSDTMRPFLNSLLSTLLKIVIVFVAVSIIGVELSGLVTIVAAMGFAIGLSLQGSLGNFASGILILFLKPYKVNDWIQIEDRFGKVEEIGIFNTILITPGKKTLIVPNAKITDGVVTNFSKKDYIRLELNIHIPYSEDFPKIKKIIQQELTLVTTINNSLETEIGIESFDSHNIILAVRPYATPENFWQATYDTHQAIKNAFNQNNIKVAYSEGVELGNIGA